MISLRSATTGFSLETAGFRSRSIPTYSYLLKDTKFLIYSEPPAVSKVMLAKVYLISLPSFLIGFQKFFQIPFGFLLP